MFWVMMNNHPEYNDKVALMQGLGPVARVDHTHSVVRIFAPFANEIEVRPTELNAYMLFNIIFEIVYTAGFQATSRRRLQRITVQW